MSTQAERGECTGLGDIKIWCQTGKLKESEESGQEAQTHRHKARGFAIENNFLCRQIWSVILPKAESSEDQKRKAKRFSLVFFDKRILVSLFWNLPPTWFLFLQFYLVWIHIENPTLALTVQNKLCCSYKFSRQKAQMLQMLCSPAWTSQVGLLNAHTKGQKKRLYNIIQSRRQQAKSSGLPP